MDMETTSILAEFGIPEAALGQDSVAEWLFKFENEGLLGAAPLPDLWHLFSRAPSRPAAAYLRGIIDVRENREKFGLLVQFEDFLTRQVGEGEAAAYVKGVKEAWRDREMFGPRRVAIGTCVTH